MKPMIKPSHRGRLHAHLGVAPGKKLTLNQLTKARNSDNPAIRKEAYFALAARKFHH